MTAPDKLYQLVEKFERDKSQFQQPDYNEAQLRQEFVNPFFAALGWDVGDSKQVLHEAGLRSGGSVKHPDYSFLAGSRRAFYVETKKPSINIGSSVEPAGQLRSYGWSGDTALGILTNFAEFAVYDCRIEPKQGDSPAEARILYLTHSQYLAEWERLREALSPEAVRLGKHSDLLEATAKGVLRVDEAFLRDMETWRVDLAPDIYKQARFIDRQLSQREINHLVQRTIDRIVFLRIAEDRNLESYGRLERAASVRRNSYNEIKTLYLAADRKYNSGLFHFDPNDKSRPDADTLSLDIRIGDGILRKIIADLYPPKSRYQFSVISADILGQVYERFLGKVIEVRSDGDRRPMSRSKKNPKCAKPAASITRRAISSTTSFENTVGALLKDKTPAEAAKLRVLDPACGSGSFLTGAYQYLLDWHLSGIPRKSRSAGKTASATAPDGIILRIEEKRRILLDNIYGVDLDQNAVEVSKLSLLLKMLENEHDTLDIEEPLLPDLSGNIKWGNSLIGSDFFSGDELAAKDDEELLRVKPFDWASGSGFGEITAAGGFDAVIGNPPWGYDFREDALHYLKMLNQKIVVRMIDSFMYFVHQFSGKTKRDGYFGMIVPDVIAYQSHNRKLRGHLLKFGIRQVLNMGDVFHKVTRPALILILQNTHLPESVEVADFSQVPKVKKADAIRSPNSYHTLSQTVFESLPGQIFVTSRVNDYRIWHKALATDHQRLRELVDHDGIQRGVSPDLKDAFIVSSETRDKYSLEESSLRPTLTGGRHVKRYAINRPDLWLIYTSRNDDFALIPNICRFIDKFASDITCKEVAAGKHPLYSLHRPRKENIFLKDRKLVGVITEDEIVIALDTYQSFPTDGVYLFGLKNDIDVYYIMGILNSKFFVLLYRLLALERGRVLAQVKPTLLNELPIRTIDFNNPADVAVHDRMVALVERMLYLHRQADLTAVQRGVVEQRIEAVDREIDELVYELYGLSEDEREIVEGG